MKIKKVVVIILAVFSVVLCSFLVVGLFPLDVRCTTNQETTTTTGLFREMQIEAKSNQPISGIFFAVDPQDPTNLKEYTRIPVSGGLKSKSGIISELKVPAGKSNLYIYTSTLFGHQVTKIKLNHEIGYTSEPDVSTIVSLENGEQILSNELLITVEDGTTAEEVTSIIKNLGGEIVGQLYYLNQYQIRFSGYGENYIINKKQELEQSELIKTTEFNLVFDASSDQVPDDSEWDSWDVSNPSGNNWGLECIDAPGSWERNGNMTPVKVGVIDSSLDYSHSDLQINTNHLSILPTNDFKTLKELEDYFDQYANTNLHTGLFHNADGNCVFCKQKDHGTHCAGIIGAIADNSNGITGTDWNADLYFTTFWYYKKSGEGQITKTSTNFGLFYNISSLVMSGCRVISISVGSSQSYTPDEERDRPYIELYDNMLKKLEDGGYDFLIIKAAGNDNDDASNYFLNEMMAGGAVGKAHTIVVGAVTNSSSLVNRLAAWSGKTEKIYNMSGYSNFGSMVDITAPGSDIYSTVYGDEYAYKSGTSMATPMTAGVASLVYSLNSDLTFDIVKTIVCNTSKNFCSKNGEIYGIINANNATKLAATYSNKLPKLEKPIVGFITGLVQDAKTLDLLDDVAVHLVNNSTKKEYESTTDNGLYEYMVPPGIYTMEFVSKKYITETVYAVEISEGLINYNILLNLVGNSSQIGTAKGSIVDAFDASTIPNAQMKFYKGVNQKQGEPVATLNSDEHGDYSVELEPGNYTVLVSADGYLADYSSVIIIGGESQNSQDCTLTPILKEGEVRVVLTWGEYPYDLDSHMVGPTLDGGQFHTFFDDKDYYFGDINYVNLDVDDTSSYGPETTSIYVGVAGTYTFYVHDYSNKYSLSSSAMSKSDAQIKIYMAGKLKPVVYNVPNQAGTLWTVCYISNGIVTPINTMGYESAAGTVGQ